MILLSIVIILIIFLINIVPAFMPPTWMLLSFVGFNFHLSNSELVILAIIAAVASTFGRVVLALLSKVIIRNKVLNDNDKQNIDVLKTNIEKRKTFTFSFFLFFALFPFSSGQIFLAYGLTKLKLWLAAVPFFIGRSISYIFWALTASQVSEMADTNALTSGAFLSIYFILGQIGAFLLVYLFIKLDWKAIFDEHKIKFIKNIIKEK